MSERINEILERLKVLSKIKNYSIYAIKYNWEPSFIGICESYGIPYSDEDGDPSEEDIAELYTWIGAEGFVEHTKLPSYKFKVTEGRIIVNDPCYYLPQDFRTMEEKPWYLNAVDAVVGEWNADTYHFNNKGDVANHLFGKRMRIAVEDERKKLIKEYAEITKSPAAKRIVEFLETGAPCTIFDMFKTIIDLPEEDQAEGLNLIRLLDREDNPEEYRKCLRQDLLCDTTVVSRFGQTEPTPNLLIFTAPNVELSLDDIQSVGTWERLTNCVDSGQVAIFNEKELLSHCETKEVHDKFYDYLLDTYDDFNKRVCVIEDEQYHYGINTMTFGGDVGNAIFVRRNDAGVIDTIVFDGDSIIEYDDVHDDEHEEE